MWTERLLTMAVCAAFALPTSADYILAPFHDRPVEVAQRALAVSAGETVAVPENDPVLAAAVAAMLLVSELGLAEAYEAAVAGGDEDDDEADTDKDPYDRAFAILQAVRPWIAAIPTQAETQTAIDDLLARLDALVPSRERPARLDADPEAAEVLAQALVGVLESAAGADLYLGRDLRRAIGTVGRLAEQACAISDAAERKTRLKMVVLYHEDTLEAPLSVMASRPAEDIEEALGRLLDAEGEHAAGCAGLITGYAEAREALFPAVSQ